MTKLFIKKKHKIGLPPGSLVYVGEKRIEDVKISIIDYNQQLFYEEDAGYEYRPF
jgi:magnesium transporter